MVIFMKETSTITASMEKEDSNIETVIIMMANISWVNKMD